MDAAGLDGLPLGELYARACRALGAAPLPEVARALSAHNVSAALTRLIVTAAPTVRNSRSVGVDVADDARNDTTTPVPIAPHPDVCQCLHTIASASSAADAVNEVHALLQPHAVVAKARQSRRIVESRMIGDSIPVLDHHDISPEVACARLAACVAQGRRAVSKVAGKHAIIILGNTGAGKSCFVNLLHGCTFALDNDRVVVRSDSPVPELMKIGHTNKSETLAPQISGCSEEMGLKGFAFADCPGFLDNRGFEVNIANAVNIKRTIAAAASARIVVMINYHSLMADRGKGVKDLFRILSSVFGSVTNAQRHAKSLLLAISKAPVMHPDTGLAMSLAQHRGRLLDPSGLDDSAAALLDAIGQENVFCFHLLEEDRGKDMHASWLRRRDIADKIKVLTPIVPEISSAVQQHGLLFHSAVDDHDKESLREMITGICDRVQTALSLGAFEMAVDLVHDLLRLDHIVGDRFVTKVVHSGVRRAVCGEEDSPGGSLTLGKLLGALRNGAEVGSISKVEENSDSEEKGVAARERPSASLLDSVRVALRRMARTLIAFAGVEPLCEELMTLLVHGSRELEAAVQDAEAAAGRQEARERLGEVVREAGDNVVKEVLLLENQENIMHSHHTAQVRQLAEAVEEEQTKRKNTHEICFEAMARARHYAYRCAAAQAHWRSHCEAARSRMKSHDVQLRESGAKEFWAKVDSSPERLREHDGDLPLAWNRKGIDSLDCEVVGAEFRADCLVSRSVHKLFLSGNRIGDQGLTAMVSHASAFGALPNLQRLHAQQNGIGCSGLATLATAFGRGQLRFLTLLDLGRNAIACDGMKAFASVLDCHVLENLATLYLSSNDIGTEGAVAFAKALLPRQSDSGSGGSGSQVLAKLKILWLNRNRIGNDGVAAFGQAVRDGALVSCEQLMFQMNPARASMQKSLMDTLRERSDSAGGCCVPEKADQYASMRGL